MKNPNTDQRRGGSSARSNPPPVSPVDARPDVSSEEIARRAYARWEQSDRSPGRDQEHWFAAENELRQSQSSASSGTPPVESDGS